jgi:hypothetical protein
MLTISVEREALEASIGINVACTVLDVLHPFVDASGSPGGFEMGGWKVRSSSALARLFRSGGRQHFGAFLTEAFDTTRRVSDTTSPNVQNVKREINAASLLMPFA